MKSPEPANLEVRTKAFALRVIRMLTALPKTEVARVLGRQVLRSGTSVGAHYREGMHARSPAEFLSKLEGGLQEMGETIYWLELLAESGTVPAARLTDLLDEAGQIRAMLIASISTTKTRSK
jgi:four helix bundle protein